MEAEGICNRASTASISMLVDASVSTVFAEEQVSTVGLRREETMWKYKVFAIEQCYLVHQYQL